MTRKRYAVRKLDTEDSWWFVVDLAVPGAAILAEAAIVDRFPSYEAAHRHADAYNSVCTCCLGDPDLVCDSCGSHSCWAGEFMCDRAVTAGVVHHNQFTGGAS